VPEFSPVQLKQCLKGATSPSGPVPPRLTVAARALRADPVAKCRPRQPDIPACMRLRLVGNPSEHVVRGQIAEALEGLVKCLRTDSPVYVQAVDLLQDLAGFDSGGNACSV
jgi:hypothetical protein